MFEENGIGTSPWSTKAGVLFLQECGQRVIQTASGYWHAPYAHGRIVMPFPLQRQAAPGKSEISEIFQQAPSAWFIRYVAPARGEGLNSFFLVRRPPYSIESLSAKCRKNTRRSLRVLNVRRLTFREVLELGWEAHSDTMLRHAEKPSGFGFDATLDKFGGYAAWGAFSGDSLAAYAVTLTIDDWAHILISRSANRFLKLCPNNACIFFLCEQLFASGYISTVSYGLESIDGLNELDHFKESMGFEKEPVQQMFAVRPLIRPLLNRHAIAVVLPILNCIGARRAAHILNLISAGQTSASY